MTNIGKTSELANAQMPVHVNSGSTPDNCESRSRLLEAVRILVIGAMMIGCSASLISFNKYLIAGPFPFAFHLVLGHMTFGSCFSFILYMVLPSMYPSLSDPEKRSKLSSSVIFRNLAPIALLFAGSLVTSNVAYFYLSVPFLQMMKEANVVLVYLLSLIVGVEVFKVRSLYVLFVICIGTMMSVAGEMHFVWIGLIIQVASQLCEVTRLVVQSAVLAGKGIKLDVLSYNLLVMPLCLITLSFTLLFKHFVLKSKVGGSPGMEDLTRNAHLLLANMALAFLLNIIMALFMKYASPTSTVVSMIVKDVMVVGVSIIFLHESVTGMQVAGLMVEIMGVLTWSMLRTFPEYFEKGIITGWILLITFQKPEASADKADLSGFAESHLKNYGGAETKPDKKKLDSPA